MNALMRLLLRGWVVRSVKLPRYRWVSQRSYLFVDVREPGTGITYTVLL